MSKDIQDRLWARVLQLQEQAVFMDRMVRSQIENHDGNWSDAADLLDQQFLIWSEIRNLLAELTTKNSAHLEYFDRLIFERRMMLMVQGVAC